MRILFLSAYFPPEVNAPAVRTHQHCRRWAAQGHEVHVVTCVPNHPRGEVYPGYRSRWAVQRERVDGVHLHRVWTYLAANRGVIRRTLAYLSYMVSAALAALRLPRPDVIVATSPHFFCACAGYIASRLLRCPWVFELRDIWPESIAAVGALKNRFLLRALEAVEMALYRDASLVVALTGAFRRNLISRGIEPAKIAVVTNGIGPAAWSSPDRPEARSRLGMEAEQFVVSYVGTHGMAHSLDTLLEAAELLADHQDIRFITAGDGAEFERLRQMKEHMGLPNVTMLGQVPRRKAKLLVQASDASAVLLRDADLFRTVIPSKIFESMAAATPILLGVGGEARRIVEGAGAGLYVEPENGRQLAQAILRLHADRKLGRRLGRNGRAAVRTRFSRQKLAGKMLEALRTCATEDVTEPEREAA